MNLAVQSDLTLVAYSLSSYLFDDSEAFDNHPRNPQTGSRVVDSGARFYNPDTGRWFQRDPIGERGGINLYGFVENQPCDLYDYLGMATVAAWNCCQAAKLRLFRRYTMDVLELVALGCIDGNKVRCSSNCPDRSRGQIGGYNPEDGGICIDPSADDRQMEITWKHEVQHAQDQCLRPIRDCDECIRNEIRAQKCAGEPLNTLSLFGNCAGWCDADDRYQFIRMYGEEYRTIYNETRLDRDCWFTEPDVPDLPEPR